MGNVCVVTEGRTLLVITQVSSGLKINRIFSALANVNTFIFILGCNDNKFDASAQVNTNSYIELMSTYNTKQQHHNKTLAAGYGGYV